MAETRTVNADEAHESLDGDEPIDQPLDQLIDQQADQAQHGENREHLDEAVDDDPALDPMPPARWHGPGLVFGISIVLGLAAGSPILINVLEGKTGLLTGTTWFLATELAAVSGGAVVLWVYRLFLGPADPASDEPAPRYADPSAFVRITNDAPPAPPAEAEAVAEVGATTADIPATDDSTEVHP